MKEEVFTTFNTEGAVLKVAVAIDWKSAAIICLALFVGITGALLIYKIA